MFRSLWFRLTGTVVFVVVVTMLVALVASLVIMRGELERSRRCQRNAAA